MKPVVFFCFYVSSVMSTVNSARMIADAKEVVNIGFRFITDNEFS